MGGSIRHHPIPLPNPAKPPRSATHIVTALVKRRNVVSTRRTQASDDDGATAMASEAFAAALKVFVIAALIHNTCPPEPRSLLQQPVEQVTDH